MLSYNYNAVLNVNVELTNPQSSEMITEVNTSTIRIRVHGRGYDIMQYELLKNKTIQIDLLSYQPHIISETERALPTSQIKELVMREIGSNFELVNISTEYIRYRVSTVATKKVPVKANVKLSTAVQFMQQGRILISPDSIIVNGPKEAVDEVQEISTETIVKDRLSAPIVGTAKLIVPKNVWVAEQNVRYEANIIRFTETILSLPITIRNVPDSIDVEIFPSMTNLHLCVSVNEYNTIKKEIMTLFVDYENMVNSMSGQVQVEYEGIPEYVLRSTVEPPFVNFVIKQKHD